jgi:type IV secretion system protein VirB5
MESERVAGRWGIGRQHRHWALISISVLVGLSARPAHAQWAVVDVGAITQLVNEVAVLEQQLKTARSELTEAQSQYLALTGTRGMEGLLRGIDRNYLPQDFAQVEQVLSGASAEYGALTTAVQTLVRAKAVLSSSDLDALSPADRSLVISARQNAALLAAVSQQALAAASDRFASLQSLIEAMASARDPKADLDLQARIEAEQAMVANEQVKLGQLRQVIEGQAAITAEQRREEAVADVGSLRTLRPLDLP